MSQSTDTKLKRLDKRMAALATERTKLLRQKAAESGWTPCDDCFNGYCSMNCSGAPGYMKVMV